MTGGRPPSGERVTRRENRQTRDCRIPHWSAADRAERLAGPVTPRFRKPVTLSAEAVARRCTTPGSPD